MRDSTEDGKFSLIAEGIELGERYSMTCKSPNECFPSQWCTHHDLVHEEARNLISVASDAVGDALEVDLDWPLVLECNLSKIGEFLVFLNLYANQQGVNSRWLSKISPISRSQALAWLRWKWVFATFIRTLRWPLGWLLTTLWRLIHHWRRSIIWEIPSQLPLFACPVSEILAQLHLTCAFSGCSKSPRRMDCSRNILTAWLFEAVLATGSFQVR